MQPSPTWIIIIALDDELEDFVFRSLRKREVFVVTVRASLARPDVQASGHKIVRNAHLKFLLVVC